MVINPIVYGELSLGIPSVKALDTAIEPHLIIGAHAAVAGHRLLTRDPRRHRTYCPRLQLIAPG